MLDAYTDPDSAANLLERRWFAAFKAASAARAQCEALLEQMAATQIAWNRAREQLVLLETLRDSLAEQMEAAENPSVHRRERSFCSAA